MRRRAYGRLGALVNPEEKPMFDHPAESQQDLAMGIVVAVHPDTWEVDVQLTDDTAALLPRCKVMGTFLPEVHNVDSSGATLQNGGRQSKVIVGWADSAHQAPVAWPIHNVIMSLAEKANHVYWSEHLNFRTTIDRANNYEVRNDNGDVVTRFRLEQEGPFARIELPNATLKLDSAGKLLELDAENIHLGTGAIEKIVLGTTFKAWLDAFIAIFNTHTHPSAGPNSNPAPPLPTILSEVAKTV